MRAPWLWGEGDDAHLMGSHHGVAPDTTIRAPR